MSESTTQENQPTEARRVRRAYLIHMFAGPWIAGMLGIALIIAAFFSNQPTALRATALPVGAIMLIVGALMPRISGPLEFSVLRSGFKANLDAMLPEALLLAREAAVQVQPADEPRREEKADEAVEHVLVHLRNTRLDDRDRLASEIMNRLIWSAYAELRDRRVRERHAADRPEPKQSIDGDEAQS